MEVESKAMPQPEQVKQQDDGIVTTGADFVKTPGKATSSKEDTNVKPAPVTTDGKKKPAKEVDVEEVAGNNKKKRPAEQELPTMPKEIAAQKIAIPRPKAPNKTLYIHFKTILQKKYKEKGQKLAAKDAQAYWKEVKDVGRFEAEKKAKNSTDFAEWLQVKELASEEQYADQQKFKEDILKWSTEFAATAEAHLQWATLEATWQNTTNLEEAIETVKNSTPIVWLDTVPKKWVAAEKQAKQELGNLKFKILVQNTFEKLKNADDDALFKHAEWHAYCLKRAARLKAIEDKEKAELEAKRPHPDHLKDLVVEGLKEQMVYFQGLGMFGERISYHRDFVTQSIFSKAFGVGPDVKEVSLDGDLCGSKTLRYGGILMLGGDITVKLAGESLTASATYMMVKPSMLGW